MKKTTVYSKLENSISVQKRIGRPKIYSDEEVLSALRALTEKLGRPPKPRDYRLFRVERPVLPSYATVRFKFGSWAAALKAARLACSGSPRPLKRRTPPEQAVRRAEACLQIRPFLTLVDLERLEIGHEDLRAYLPDALVLRVRGEMAELLSRVAEAGFPRPAKPEHARGRNFALMVAEGATFEEIGRYAGLTRERIRQVVAAYARHVLSEGTLPWWSRGYEACRAEATAALKAAADELGRTPTKAEYLKLRRAHPSWPPLHVVEGTLGKWRRAVYLALTGQVGMY